MNCFNINLEKGRGGAGLPSSAVEGGTSGSRILSQNPNENSKLTYSITTLFLTPRNLNALKARNALRYQTQF